MRFGRHAFFRTIAGLLLLTGMVVVLWLCLHERSHVSSKAPKEEFTSAARHPWEMSRTSSSRLQNRPKPNFSISSAVDGAHSYRTFDASFTPPSAEPHPSPQPPVSGRLPTEIHEGSKLAEVTSAVSPEGIRRRTTLYRTTFKYPLLRTEEQITLAPDGTETIVKRRTMVADHLKVRLRRGATESQLRDWLAQRQWSIRRHIPGTPYYLVSLPSADLNAYDHALQVFSEDASSPTAYAEPDYVVHILNSPPPADPPNDPRFGNQWNLHNTGQGGGTHGSDVQVLPAWSISKGSQHVVVAVLDTGIQLDHPDLAANIWVNSNEIPGDGIDNDNNGYVDDLNGYNFVSNNSTPEDDHGHGSHTAGIIGAVGDNGEGVSGVAQVVKIMVLKFLNENGSGADSDAIEGLVYATANGAMLTSNSWGGGDYSEMMEEVIQDAAAANMGCVIAAGNDGTNNDIIPVYPACYQSPNIISVGATDAADTYVWFSCYGKNTVHLAAPGYNVLSTVPGSNYEYNSGTSMAAPHVSGAAALMRAANPNMSFAAIKAALIAQARPVDSHASKSITSGVLDIGNAIPLSIAPYPVLIASQIDDTGTSGSGTSGNDDGIFSPGETVALTITLQNLGGHPTGTLQGTLALASADPQITLSETEASFGIIDDSAAAQNATSFIIRADADHPTPAHLPLTLTLVDDQDRSWTLDLILHLYTTSLVSGKVTQLDGSTPIINATVHFEGTIPVNAVTNEEGAYQATLVDGNYAVTASAANYITSNPQNIQVPPPMENLNFSLGFSELEVSPMQLSATLQEDTTTTRTLTLQNHGNQALTWRVLEVIGAGPDSSSSISTLPTSSKPPVLGSRSSKLATHFPQPRSTRGRSAEEGPIGRLRVPAKIRTTDNDTATVSTLPFADGFEDGTYHRWFESFTQAVREVVTDTVAEGSHSFHFRLDGMDDHLTGIHQEFEWDTRPGYVSFRIRTSKRDAASGYVVLGDVSDGYLDDFIWFFCNANGRFYINDDVGGNQLVAYEENRWYHIEFRNIDWNAKTFDYVVDGVVYQTGVPFRNAEYVDECAYAFVYNYQQDVDAWWDEFVFSHDALDWLSISPHIGSTAPDSSTTLTATFDAHDVLAGTYHGNLRLLTNDPLQPETMVPVEMVITPRPNTAPIALSSNSSTSEDTRRLINLSGSDAENDPLTYRITQLPTVGMLYQTDNGVTPTTWISQVPTLVTSSQHQVIYVPPPNTHGSPLTSIQFTVHDGRIESSPATIDISVSSINDAPSARPDDYSVLPGQPMILTVLDNDYSADLRNFNISQFTQPTGGKGTVSNIGNSKLIFTPADSFVTGSTTFTYTISDGMLSNTTTVTIRMGPLTAPEWPTHGADSHRSHYYPATVKGAFSTLNLLWNHQFEQIPNAPVVGGGKAYFTTHRIDEEQDEDETIIALDLVNGDVAWTQSEPVSDAINDPLWNGNHLYFTRTNIYDESFITTLNANNGTLFSSYTFPGIPSEIGKHLLYSHQLIYLPGGPGAKLYAVEPGTNFAPFITSLPYNQTATATSADHLILLATFGTVRALDPTLGIFRWTFKPDPALNDAADTGTIAWRAGRAFIILGGRLHAIHTLQLPSLAWSSVNDEHRFSPILAGNRVYAVHGDHEVRAYDMATGELVETYTVPQVIQYQPVICQEYLIVPTEPQLTHVLRLSDGEVEITLPSSGHLTVGDHVLLITDPAPDRRRVDAYGFEPEVFFTPGSMTSHQPISVHVGTFHNDATIHYTTDGQSPTTSSPVYQSQTPFHFLRSTQLKAIAVRGDYQSPVNAAFYTILDANENGLPDWWEGLHGASRPGSPDNLDPDEDYDHDGRTNLEEFVLGTNPNASDHLSPNITHSTEGVVTLTWPSQPGRLYTILSSASLISSDWQEEITARNLPGTGDILNWSDPAPPNDRKFYRLKVSLPPLGTFSP